MCRGGCDAFNNALGGLCATTHGADCRSEWRRPTPQLLPPRPCEMPTFPRAKAMRARGRPLDPGRSRSASTSSCRRSPGQPCRVHSRRTDVVLSKPHAHRRDVCSTSAGPGAADTADRQLARRPFVAARRGSRRRCRACLHDAARRPRGRHHNEHVEPARAAAGEPSVTRRCHRLSARAAPSRSMQIVAGPGRGCRDCTTHRDHRWRTRRREGRCGTEGRRIDGSLTIGGDETHPPYERPPLSKEYLQGGSEPTNAGRAGHLVRPARRDSLEGAPPMDRPSRRVVPLRGRVLPYDVADHRHAARNPRQLDIPGRKAALTLRNLEDSDALKAAYARRFDRRHHRRRLDRISTPRRSPAQPAPSQWCSNARTCRSSKSSVTTSSAYFATAPQQRRRRAHVCLSAVDLRAGPYVVHADGGDIEADVVVMGVVPSRVLSSLRRRDLTSTTAWRSTRRSVRAIPRYSPSAMWRTRPTRIARWGHCGSSTGTTRFGRARRWLQIILGEGATYDWQPYFFSDQFDLGRSTSARSARHRYSSDPSRQLPRASSSSSGSPAAA